MNEAQAKTIARALYVLLTGWHFAWLGLLPAPHGKENLVLAAVLTLPLLLPLWSILRGSTRGLIWGGYIVVFASMLGMVELWSAPPERPAALLQLALCGSYLVFLALATRRRKR